MIRNLCVVFGDQLNRDAVIFDDFDPRQDRVWMAESGFEANGYVWSHKQRIAIFLSAMRHFAEGCRKDGLPIDYHALDDQKQACSLGALLAETLETLSPAAVHVTKPYLATGKYIDRMSNYCKKCACNPAIRTGPGACPFTVLYWDSLQQHERKLSGNQRMSLQLRNLDKITDDEKKLICQQAARIRQNPAAIPR